MNNNFFRITIFFSIFLLANLYSIKTSASNHKVLEINEARGTVTTLNKKYPKPQLENFGSQNKKSGTFNGQGCKGSKKNKSINFYKGNHTIDIFVACRITSPTGYHEQLRKVADKVAARYCKSEYSSKTYYRGRSFTSALDDKAWRLVGDALSLGLLINKRTVALSYVCGDKYETYENDTNESNIDLSNKSTRRLCEQGTLLSGDWSPYKINYRRELGKRKISLEYCNSLTGREVTALNPNPLSIINEKNLCLRATTRNGYWESSKSKFKLYVKEATQRGIKLEECNIITGRGIDNSKINTKPSTDLSDKSTRRLCEQSTLLSGDWSPYKKNYKRELVKRNISLEYCNSLTGRGKEVIIGGSNVVVALDLNTLCLRATTKEGLWESSYGKFSKYVNEINRRGISLVKCNKITGRDKNNSDYLIVIIFVIFILILVIYLKSLNKRANVKQAKEQRAKEQRVKEEQAKEQRAKEQRAKEQRVKEEQAKEQRAKEQRAKEQRVKEEQAKEQRAKGEQAKQQRAKAEQAKAEQAKEKKVKNEEESEESATADVKDFLID